jgi:hypothetical protein
MRLSLDLGLGPRSSSGNAPAPSTGFPATTSIVAIGDSFTNGSNEPSIATAYLALLSGLLGSTYLNKGVGGTVLQNTNKTTSGTPDGNNMRDRFVADCFGANARETLIIAGGYNDVRLSADQLTYTPAAFGGDLREMLTLAITSGTYTRDRIVSAAPWWITDAGIATGTGGQVNPSPPRSTFNAYHDEWLAAVTEYGVYAYDAYEHLRGNGYQADTDNIHPQKTANGNNGHVLIANGFYTQTSKLNSLPSVTGMGATSNTNGRLDTTFTAYPGAVSYEVETAPSGSPVYTPGATPSTNSANITGLTPLANYVYRVRAVMADASKSPWAFYTTPTTIAAADDALLAPALAAMTVQPTTARRTLLNNLFVGLRNAGQVSKVLGLWVTAAHDEQAARLNLMNPGTGTGQILSVVGGVTFTTDREFVGNATTGQLDTGMNLVGYQDNGGMFYWTRASTGHTQIDMGNANSLLQTRNTSGSISGRINAASGGGTVLPADGSGFTGWTRINSTTLNYVHLAGVTTVGSVTSAAPDAVNTIRLMGRSGTASYSPAGCSAAGLTAGAVGTDLQAIRDLLAIYMAGVGA